MNKRLTLTVLLAAGLGLSACAKKAPQVLPPDPGGAPSQSAGSENGAPVPGSQADFVAQLNAWGCQAAAFGNLWKATAEINEALAYYQSSIFATVPALLPSLRRALRSSHHAARIRTAS